MSMLLRRHHHLRGSQAVRDAEKAEAEHFEQARAAELAKAGQDAPETPAETADEQSDETPADETETTDETPADTSDEAPADDDSSQDEAPADPAKSSKRRGR